MKNINWDNVQEAGEFNDPTPGGYAARITNVEDWEKKECLKIEWDFADGEFKGHNREISDKFGFWPISCIRSYKEKALPFFKAFKTAVENSNPGYTFKNDPQSLVGKFIGVVLGEEEYEAKDGSIKTRLYVDQIRSGQAIRDGDFKVPEKKTLAPRVIEKASNAFPVLTENDDQLPF